MIGDEISGEDGIDIRFHLCPLRETAFDPRPRLGVRFPRRVSDCLLEPPVLPLLSVSQHFRLSLLPNQLRRGLVKSMSKRLPIAAEGLRRFGGIPGNRNIDIGIARVRRERISSEGGGLKRRLGGGVVEGRDRDALVALSQGIGGVDVVVARDAEGGRVRLARDASGDLLADLAHPDAPVGPGRTARVVHRSVARNAHEGGVGPAEDRRHRGLAVVAGLGRRVGRGGGRSPSAGKTFEADADTTLDHTHTHYQKFINKRYGEDV
nr:hypothetical protein Iba_chr05bCG0340 [Ipomoea batatas]